MKKAVMFFTMICMLTMTAGCGASQNKVTVSSASSSAVSSETDSAADSDGTDADADASDQENRSGENDSAGSNESTADSSAAAGDATSLVTPIESLDLTDMFSKRDQDASYDESSSAKITLTGTSAEVAGSGAAADGSVVTITEEGTYIVSGTLTDGQIVVDADDAATVQIVLEGAEITNNDSACILVLSADKVFVTLADGTSNTLSDTGDAYTQQSDEYTVDGVIFSREDLTLNGSGTLTINANYKHAVVSKDDLVVAGGTYEITAKNKGLAGKDSVRTQDGTINITSEDDAIHTSNAEDAGKGFVYIEGGTLTLAAGDDGIHAETALIIAGGTIGVTKSYEGLEGASIDVMDGTVNVTASDDGMNASISDGDSDKANGVENDGFMFRDQDAQSQDASGQDGSADQMQDNNAGQEEGIADQNRAAGTLTAAYQDSTGAVQNNMTAMGGRGGMGGGGMMDAQPAAYLKISGGTVHVNAEGDGLDSNGMLYIAGGTTTVSGPTNSGNGALDYGTGAEISGGTIIAAGSLGMAETFSDSSSQYSVMYNLESAVSEGTEVSLVDAEGNTVLTMTPEKTYQSVIFSSPDIKEGTYTVKAGSSEESVEVTGVVTMGGASGGMNGGHGGMGGGFGGRGQTGQTDDGSMPEMNGQMPDGSDGTMPQGGRGMGPGGKGRGVMRPQDAAENIQNQDGSQTTDGTADEQQSASGSV
ncbi:MAG: carbohydrate-binding domain-containing protein [Eubacterium sp.]|nr:carbohydrate-binding domain-containing protein [Eubacterium sp.]